MRAATACTLLSLSLVCSCKGSGSSDSSGKQPAPAAEGPGAAATAVPAEADRARPAEPAIPQVELQALLASWLKAQNDGDFAAYETLYAEKFSGVKRVGPKTFRYARAGWLANRKLMFRHEMTVEARDPEFNATSRVAQVTFTQRWASGKFEDLGPKRMLFVREGGTLKIAQEEMLRSEIVRKDQDRGADFYFLLDGDLVLHDATVPDEHGKPEYVDGDSPIVTRASVEKRDLDDETRALEGGKFRVDNDCEATVTGFYLVSRVLPHFGVTQEWNCDQTEDDCEPASEAERAEQAFGMGNPVVVAKLSGCQGGTYARPAARPAVTEGEAVSDAALEKKAIAAFGKLRAVRSQAPDDEADGPKQWWKGIEKAAIFRHPHSGKVLVSVYADNGGMCGEFSANAWVLWEYRADKLVQLVDGTAPAEILDALDVDGDGVLELLVKGDDFGSEAVLIDASTMSALVTLEYSYGDCPC